MEKIAVESGFAIKPVRTGAPVCLGRFAAGISTCRDPDRQDNVKTYSNPAIGLVESGCFAYANDCGEYSAVPGTILLGNAGEQFSCRHADGYGNRRAVVVLERGLLEEAARDTGAEDSVFSVAALAPVRHHLALGAAIRRIAYGGDRGEDAAYELAGLALLASTGRQPPDPAGMGPRADIARAVRFAQANFREPCDLAGLAAIARLSRFHFLRQFRQATGTSPHQYVLNLRLRTAAEDLRASDARIIDIAYDSGFSDLSQFNRLFRRSFAMTPSQWRMGRDNFRRPS